jgi:hypothetical protein
MHGSNLASEELQVRPHFVRSISEEMLVRVETDRHQEGICGSRPKDKIFSSCLGIGRAGIEVGNLSQGVKKKKGYQETSN